MRIARIVSAVLLALPLLLFGVNYFVEFLPQPEAASSGMDFLQSMRDSGLMAWIALSHIVIGLGLLIPRTRFFAALMNVPMSIGIIAFHLTMMPEGTPMAIVILVFNLLAMWEPQRIKNLL